MLLRPHHPSCSLAELIHKPYPSLQHHSLAKNSRRVGSMDAGRLLPGVMSAISPRRGVQASAARKKSRTMRGNVRAFAPNMGGCGTWIATGRISIDLEARGGAGSSGMLRGCWVSGRRPRPTCPTNLHPIRDAAPNSPLRRVTTETPLLCGSLAKQEGFG
ncbi:uncharacterized protein A4U43_C05F7190 [Asparagus officinalis]|uniref:Uncharacterized protein n=1 Tax=Asparagus officinalis TaxID=4686 RepID=A0A5P1EPZ7_ASPOF|nr:uncharacterized protein A4U43_C05F7190 [Asparagus officinalis]